jgi:fluoride exporter
LTCRQISSDRKFVFEHVYRAFRWSELTAPFVLFGRFAMGVLSPTEGKPPLPWLRADHPLQKNTALRVGLQVGFCGCLTTCKLIFRSFHSLTMHVSYFFFIFKVSSWNNQMVIMMDGSDTEFGPQVGAALFGYLLGVVCAVASFVFGRVVYDWVRCRQTQPSLDEATAVTVKDSIDNGDVGSRTTDASPREFRWRTCRCLDIRYLSLFAIIGLFVVFAHADIVYESLVYRELWMSILLTPFGALLRWRIAEFNVHNLGRIRKELVWFPWGTFAVNVVAAIVCAFVEAFVSRHVGVDDRSLIWVAPILRSLKMGFAGSLSTVSTFVREMVTLETPARATNYCVATVVCSMLFSLLVYSPTIRSG